MNPLEINPPEMTGTSVRQSPDPGELPLYSFSFMQGKYSKSVLTADLSDTNAVHKKAVAVFVGLIRDIAGELETHPAWQMEVLDETGKPVFRLKLLGESLA
jgi:hypothetical protein